MLLQIKAFKQVLATKQLLGSQHLFENPRVMAVYREFLAFYLKMTDPTEICVIILHCTRTKTRFLKQRERITLPDPF